MCGQSGPRKIHLKTQCFCKCSAPLGSFISPLPAVRVTYPSLSRHSRVTLASLSSLFRAPLASLIRAFRATCPSPSRHLSEPLASPIRASRFTYPSLSCHQYEPFAAPIRLAHVTNPSPPCHQSGAIVTNPAPSGHQSEPFVSPIRAHPVTDTALLASPIHPPHVTNPGPEVDGMVGLPTGIPNRGYGFPHRGNNHGFLAGTTFGVDLEQQVSRVMLA